METLYKTYQKPYRFLILVGSVIVLLATPTNYWWVLLGSGLLIFFIIVLTIFRTDESLLSLKQDLISRKKVDSYNCLIDVLSNSKFIDEDTNENNFLLECLESSENNQVFVLTSTQPGRNIERLTRILEDSKFSFDSSRVIIEPVDGQTKNSTFRITFSKLSEFEILQHFKIPYSRLLEMAGE